VVKVKTTVKRRDGSRIDLPTVEVSVSPPSTPIVGPEIPQNCGGGTVIVEIVDAVSGERLAKGNAPVSY